MPIKKSVVCIAVLLSMAIMPLQARRGPQGHAEKTFGPNGGGELSADRTIKGPNADSSFNASGPNGKSVSGTASSTAVAGKGQGEATVTTSGGRSATAEGSGSVKGDTASGSGNIQTSGGHGVTGSGTATKTDSGVSATGTATANNGKSVTGSVDGNKEAGAVTVQTKKGQKIIYYGNRR